MNLGKIDVWRILAQNLLAFANFLMITVLFLRDTGWHCYYLLFVPAGLLFMWWYVRRVFPENVEYQFTRSESIQKLFADVEEIKRRLK